ncbi:hypothetical protein ABH927_006289 [Planotetraspora sp. GP83]
MRAAAINRAGQARFTGERARYRAGGGETINRMRAR